MHYYIQKGFKPEYLLGLDELSKLYFYASLSVAVDERNNALEGLE